MKNYYITTTLPYVNSEPHIGFASEIVRADILARFHRDVLKEKVFFNTGTDEHGQKIYDKAQEQKITPQEFCDKQVEKFKALKENLNLSFDNFVRTTDEDHIKSAQEFWRRCYEKGDIYKAKYKVKYCVGCELEKTDSELNEKGRCPLHPNKDLQVSEEENYFFKFSNYQKPLLDFYQKNPDFVQPEKRFNEIKNFVKENLKDFSISRLKSKMSWGVPVPDDEKQVMYVWFDALVNYISVLNWPEDENNFKKWWPGVQIAGKDNLRQQSAMWQAMLMSAGLSNSEKIYINGFIISDGQKMSKSLGNVISPAEMVEKFGVDGTRYLLIASAIFGEDVDLTWERMFEKYNSDLANGLGNVFSRVIKLSQKIDLKNSEILDFMQKEVKIDLKRYSKDFESGHLERLLSNAQQKISELDKKIETVKPWQISKTDPEKFQAEMLKFLTELKEIQEMIVIFLPETAEKMKRMLETREMESLFPRIQEN
jgi:methionyl-tRNA synthetase